MTLIDFSALGSVYCRSCPKELQFCLSSLSLQTLPPKDVVVVVDGPVPNEIYNILLQYEEDLPLTIVRQKSNLGLQSALNLGLDYCLCEYVLRFDTDDYSRSDRSFRLLTYLDSSTSSVVSSFCYEFTSFDSNGFPIAEQIRRAPCSHPLISFLLPFFNPVAHPTVAFRKSAVLSVGKYPDIPFAEDYGLWIKLFTKGHHFGCLDEPLVYFNCCRRLSNRRLMPLTSIFKLAFLFYKYNIFSSFVFLANFGVLRSLVLLFPRGLIVFLLRMRG